jgi:anthranilate/para-aminobenzoate synthase component II
MILLIDNYDSFTYNLVQRLGEVDPSLDIEVHRNDQITLDEIAAKRPTHIIVSPGPCTPTEAGISVPVIERFMEKVPILGVCLGHQSIGQATGGIIVRAKRLPSPLVATRYHSLVIRPDTLNPDFVVSATANADDGSQEIMAIRHKRLPLVGVQFHPESFLTEHGHEMLRNFLAM